MKAAWDQLGDEYADSSSVLIGDVDCTSEDDGRKALCDKYEVKGFPTIKYFVDGDKKGQDYQSGRDFDSLKKHVEDNLEAKCFVSDQENCSEKEKVYIAKMQGKTEEERQKQLARLEGMKGDSMKSDLKKWLIQRLNILKMIDESKSEL